MNIENLNNSKIQRHIAYLRAIEPIIKLKTNIMSVSTSPVVGIKDGTLAFANFQIEIAKMVNTLDSYISYMQEVFLQDKYGDYDRKI